HAGNLAHLRRLEQRALGNLDFGHFLAKYNTHCPSTQRREGAENEFGFREIQNGLSPASRRPSVESLRGLSNYFLFLRRTCSRIGAPRKLNLSRSLLTRNRSYEK